MKNLVACLSLSLLSTSVIAAALMKVAVLDFDLDEGEDEPGLDYLVEAARQIDIELELIPLPEARASRLLELNLLDGEAFPYDFPSRKSDNMLKIDVPIESSKLWIWVPQDQNCVAHPDQLSNFKPVGLNGIPYFNIFYQLSEVGFEKVSSPKLMVEMLRRGRADYFAASKRSVEFIYSAQERQQIKPCFDQHFIEITSYFYLNKKHQAIAELLEQELLEVVNSHPDDDDD
ncbi:hypothetical protein [Agarivorans sp. 1_MG-2023]|uniref:hypothetical protein n=1 Tax=Agarivorans sp. 1_MG-2023 TaxID=3062634 RepID=UPI0026E2B7FA|nr:hypothetical protein [Agarivorans sp. 1_MG-2023]MDO6763057.1 hypothetical protein [Agarivorans sp. 1_MG-2023]